MSTKRMFQWINGGFFAQCIALALISRFVAPHPDAGFEVEMVACGSIGLGWFAAWTFRR